MTVHFLDQQGHILLRRKIITSNFSDHKGKVTRLVEIRTNP